MLFHSTTCEFSPQLTWVQLQIYILDLLQFNHVRKSRKQSHYIEVVQEVISMEQNMRFGLVLGQLAILEKNWAVKYGSLWTLYDFVGWPASYPTFARPPYLTTLELDKLRIGCFQGPRETLAWPFLRQP